ncbi:O-methyltransferase [Aureococcus anophagefferens]|nr:O-methyltransferase [Aureococcus anophagefferens]
MRLAIAALAVAGGHRPQPIRQPSATQRNACSRRALAPLATLAASPRLAVAADYDAAFAASVKLDDAAFYERYPFRVAADVLSYVEAVGAPATARVRRWRRSARYPMFAIGPVKGLIVDDVVRRKRPTSVLEVGSFLGYSAVRIGSQLPKGAAMVCVEASDEFAATARRIVAHAGLGSVVDFVVGRAEDVDLGGLAGRFRGGAADLVFLDHCKECYAPDLRRLEGAGLVAKGTVVVADNVVYPGAPGYLDAVAAPDYATVLRDAPYESKGWETKWKEVPDAMSVSTRLR